MAYVSQQIRDLRRQGNLKDALSLASQAHREAPGDIYITRELTWVLYGCLKRYSDETSKYRGNADAYLKTLKAIVRHRFEPAENEMFYENLIKNIGSVAWDIAKRKDTKSLRGLFELVRDLSDFCPGARNAILLRAFLTGFEENARYILDTVSWYDLRSFTDKDCADEMYQEEKYSGIAEKAVNAYLDALVKKNFDGSFIANRQEQEEAVAKAAPFAKRPACAHWEWLTYKLGKLFYEMGRMPEAREMLGAFLFTHQNLFYAWGAYSDACLPDQPGMYHTCLFKCLQLSSAPEYALGYHEKALEVFVEEGNYAAAKTEALLISGCRSERGWKNSQLVCKVEQTTWFAETEARKDNRGLYEELSRNCDSVLAERVPRVDFYLEWADPKRGLLGITAIPSYATSMSLAQRSVIKDKRRAVSLKPGELYNGSYSAKARAIYGEVQLSSNQRLRSLFVQPFEGVFESVGSHGYVRANRSSIYIPDFLVARHDIPPYALVSGKQVAVYKKKGDEDAGQWKREARIVQVTPPDPNEYEALIEGAVRISPKGDGFVGDSFFIPGSIVSECDLQRGDWVKANAHKIWNKKRESWAWRVYEILDRIDADDPRHPEREKTTEKANPTDVETQEAACEAVEAATPNES